MQQRPADLIDRLEEEWRQLLRRQRPDEAVRRWGRVEPALDFESADALVRHLADQRVAPDQHDRVLAALLGICQDEPLAARIVLQRFLPYVKKLASDTPAPLERDEWLTLLISTAFEVVRTYPLDRRPERIAANIVCDFRKRVHAGLRTHRRNALELTQFGSESLSTDRDDRSRFAQVEAEDLLRWAVDEELIDEPTAALMVLTRIYGLTVAWIASEMKTAKATLRQRRWRAERRIAAALASEVA